MFGRYVGSPVSMHSGNSSDTDYSYGYTEEQLAELRKRGLLDKNSDMYKAKRERNNIAVCRGIDQFAKRPNSTILLLKIAP